MAKINYADKSTAETSPLPNNQKWRSADANEVKASVNALHDVVDGKEPKFQPFWIVNSGTSGRVLVNRTEDVNGKPGGSGGGWTLFSQGGNWNFTNGSQFYQSSEDVGTPQEVVTWTAGGGAVEPFPEFQYYGDRVQDAVEKIAIGSSTAFRAYVRQDTLGVTVDHLYENSIGSIVFTRDEGQAILTLSGAFPLDRTEVDIALNAYQAGGECALNWAHSSDQIIITAFDSSGTPVNEFFFNIRITKTNAE